jgi:hypothetical protein
MLKINTYIYLLQLITFQLNRIFVDFFIVEIATKVQKIVEYEKVEYFLSEKCTIGHN